MSYPEVKDLLNRMREASYAERNKLTVEIRRTLIPALQAALQDPQTATRLKASRDIVEIVQDGRLVLLEGVITTLIAPLIAGLGDGHPEVRQAYTETLGSIVNKFSTEEADLNMLNPRLKAMVQRIDQPLRGMLADEVIGVRLEAANKVKYHEAAEVRERARNILITTLDDPNPAMRRKAASNLLFDWNEEIRTRAEQILESRDEEPPYEAAPSPVDEPTQEMPIQSDQDKSETVEEAAELEEIPNADAETSTEPVPTLAEDLAQEIAVQSGPIEPEEVEETIEPPIEPPVPTPAARPGQGSPILPDQAGSEAGEERSEPEKALETEPISETTPTFEEEPVQDAPVEPVQAESETDEKARDREGILEADEEPLIEAQSTAAEGPKPETSTPVERDPETPESEATTPSLTAEAVGESVTETQDETPEPLRCPKCGSTRLTSKQKLYYQATNQPANRFIDLFGGTFMALTGVGILWLTFANWGTQPSWYLLASGIGLLAGGLQAVKYLRSAKERKYACKCIQCRHAWQISEGEYHHSIAKPEGGPAVESQGTRRLPGWLILVLALAFVLCCIVSIVTKTAIAPREITMTPTPTRTTAPTATVMVVLEKPSDTARPSSTSQPTATDTATDTQEPSPSATRRPSDTPRPTSTPQPTRTLTKTPTAAQASVKFTLDHVIQAGFPLNSVALSPDGQTLVVGGEDQIAQVWGLGGDLRLELVGHEADILSVAISPDGNTIATGGDDDAVRLWKARTGSLQATLTGHRLWVNSVAFSEDGEVLASGSADRTVILWDASTGQVRYTLKGPADWVRVVAFSPDGRLVAAGSCAELKAGSDIACARGEIWLWNTDGGQVEAHFTGEAGWVLALSFSPDGMNLAAGSDDGSLRIWDVKSGQIARTLAGHPMDINCVVYAPGGRMLASASYDGQITIWDTETGAVLQRLEAHSTWSSINGLAFSPDGTLLVSAGEDQRVIVWQVDQQP